MTVRWLTQAFADLDQIVDYLLDRDPPAALSVYEAIQQQVGLLAEHPQIGRPGRVRGTRELVITGLPYIVAYYLKGQDVRILAVLHTARKWPQSFALE